MKESRTKKPTKGTMIKIALVFVFGIVLGVITMGANLTFQELLVFLQITLLACILALMLDLRKIMLTGKE